MPEPHPMSRVLFFVFAFVVILFYFILSANPFGIMKHFRIPVMILSLIAVFGVFIFIEYYTKQTIYKTDTVHELGANFMIYGIKYMYYLFYFLVISILLYGLFVFLENAVLWTFQFSFLVSMGLLLLVMMLFSPLSRQYKFDSPTIELVKTMIMYIPCLMTDVIDAAKEDYENTPSTVFIVFMMLLVYLLFFYVVPFYRQVRFNNDGILLLNKPAYLNHNVLAMTSDELKEKIFNGRPFYDRWFQKWAIKQQEKEIQQSESLPLDFAKGREHEKKQLLVPPDRITSAYYRKEPFTSIANQDGRFRFLSLDQLTTRMKNLYGSSFGLFSKDAFSDETPEQRMQDFILKHPQVLTFLEKVQYVSSMLFASRDTMLYSPLLLTDGQLFSKNLYHYALTSWVYLQEIEGTEMQLIYSFGSRPSLYYDPVLSSLMVILNYGLPTQKILYKTDKILFQRWNFIVMNYSYGTLDLFINNNLVGTYPDAVSYIDPDDLLIVGSSKNKKIGGICNMKYYELPIDSRKINSIYTAFHNKKIPL